MCCRSRGFSADELKELRAAYRVLVGGKKNVSQALEELRGRLAAGEAGEHVRYLVEFVGKSERGVIR
jgi:UDP-N-acetylglucosamine acyltransferase